MIEPLETLAAPEPPEAGWLDALAPQSRFTATGRIELGLSETGIVRIRLSGAMDLKLARGFTELLEGLYDRLAADRQRCFMLIDALGLERLSFQAQRFLLAFGRRELPDIAGIHCAVANPIFRALLRLFQQVQPQGRYLISWYPSCEVALEAARQRLRTLQQPLSERGPELCEDAYQAASCSLRYFQPEPGILLTVLEGVTDQAAAQHMVDVHARRFRELRERYGRVVVIIDCLKARHATIESYRVFGRAPADAMPQPGDLLIVINKHWPRAVEALTQRLIKQQAYGLRIVEDLAKALQIATADETLPVAEPVARRRLPWFGLRRRLREQQAEIEALRAEREAFLAESGHLLADILLHKDGTEVHSVSQAQQASAYHEIYESLYLLQSEYQEYLGTLQQEIDERISAERVAAESSQIKSRFLANVSHELRTPLNAIIGFSNLLQRPKTGPLNEVQARYIERVQDNSMHLLALINDVLDISKIESGTLHLHREPMQVSDLLLRVLEPLQAQARDKGLRLELHCDAGVPDLLRSDPDRLRQILGNLVGNALKFTESGAVTVRYRHWPSPGHPIALEISDTGIGIAPEDQKRIFEAFTQLHASSYPGAGLGLSICLNLAYALGCRLELESEPGQGSLFRLLLPAAMLPAD